MVRLLTSRRGHESIGSGNASLRFVFGFILVASITSTVRQWGYLKLQTLDQVLNSVHDAYRDAPVTRETISQEAEAAVHAAPTTANGQSDSNQKDESRKPIVSKIDIVGAPAADSDNQTLSTEFKRYDKVVITTKIHGPHQWLLLEQSMCLLHFAYNQKVHYDIVVFTALEVPEDKIKSLQELVSPAKFSVVLDNIGFQNEVAALTPSKLKPFLKRCKVDSPVNLTWGSNCPGRLAYNWQAEFRSVRIWEHPALKDYKYMLWLDSDGFPSKPWAKDPIEYFIQNEAVIMYDNWPQGQTGMFNQQIVDNFGFAMCDLHVNKTLGHLQRKLLTKEDYELKKKGKYKGKCSFDKINMIHGFFHITDLDFFRQPKVINGLKGLLGDCFLCRTPDDQLAVTVPPAIYAPEKALDMRAHGFHMGVFHNYNIDGKEKAKPPGFTKYWRQVANQHFPAAAANCEITQAS